MNLRVNTEKKEPIKKYWYFINYGYFATDGRSGEGMTEMYYDNKPIESMKQVEEVADAIIAFLKKDINDKVNQVLIRNFILLRIEGENDGTQFRETESSSEDDKQVSEGSQR